jgi:hypothetical protein
MQLWLGEKCSLCGSTRRNVLRVLSKRIIADALTHTDYYPKIGICLPTAPPTEVISAPLNRKGITVSAIYPCRAEAEVGVPIVSSRRNRLCTAVKGIISAPVSAPLICNTSQFPSSL